MEKIQDTVLSWYKEKGRSLPWRETTDPYKILVSEIMLQQTQVDRVIPKYEKFLATFPIVGSLAKSETADILKLWSGLGYNRRALYLHKCAKAIMEEYNGKFPKKYEELLKLPGIGKYTGAAVLSFAFNKDIPVVDVNIEVLYKRIYYNKFDKVEAIAQLMLPKGHSRDWHNALMDIGALFCTARNPKCNECPINKHCASANDQEKIEATWKKKKVKPFKESDRIVRGEIVKLLTTGTQTEKTIYVHLTKKGIERTKEKIKEILQKLKQDQLIKINEENITLP